MNEKMVRVHEDFKTMLDNTLEKLNGLNDEKHSLTMVELTKILASNTNGSGVFALRMPIVIIPDKRNRGKPPKKPLFQRYINIVLEDEPR